MNSEAEAAIAKRDLIYWYRQFRHLLSGWTKEDQIQFHQYAIDQLKKKGGETHGL